MNMNPGFDKEEIEQLKVEMAEEGQNFVLVDDEEDAYEDEGEMVHFQFVGTYEGNEVIYDTLLFTLALHHSSLVYEEAEKKVQKIFKDYVPVDERTENYKTNEDAELMIEELIEEMEDEETVKVAEFIEIDPDFEFGISLEVALNVDEITIDIIEKFIADYNSSNLKLDNTMYSFKNEAED